MIRCVRLWTGDDKKSHFEEGVIELQSGQRGDWLTDRLAVAAISFQETGSGGAFAWHTAQVRQLVVTLSGTLDFQTRDGEHFLLHLAEDTIGSGHSWTLTDDSSWRRAYVVLEAGAAVPFVAHKRQRSRPEARGPGQGTEKPHGRLEGEIRCEIDFQAMPAFRSAVAG